jgi:hypothetical protein
VGCSKPPLLQQRSDTPRAPWGSTFASSKYARHPISKPRSRLPRGKARKVSTSCFLRPPRPDRRDDGSKFLDSSGYSLHTRTRNPRDHPCPARHRPMPLRAASRRADASSCESAGLAPGTTRIVTTLDAKHPAEYKLSRDFAASASKIRQLAHGSCQPQTSSP